MLAHSGLSDCWGSLSNIVGILPCDIKLLEATVIVNWHYKNKTELNSDKFPVAIWNCGIELNVKKTNPFRLQHLKG